jgi:DNA-binding LacI/PurR family transcriptional regulator/DNA-binding transcriptional regulator YhcF (GntR family)
VYIPIDLFNNLTEIASFMHIAQPKVRQAAEFIIGLISSGMLDTDRRLPGLRAMARQSGLSAPTLLKAANHLKTEGILTGGGRSRYAAVYGRDVKEAQRKIAPDETQVNARHEAPYRYAEITRRIARDILTGVYKQDRPLPSHKELQRRYSASYPTVSKALRALCEQELIVADGRLYRIKGMHASSAGSARIAILCVGTESGLPLFTMHDQEMVKLMEIECSQSNIFADILTFVPGEEDIEFFAPGKTASKTFKDTGQTFGYIYIINTRESFQPAILHQLDRLKKPVAILDESGEWEVPPFVLRNRRMRIFRTTISKRPAEKVGRFLLSQGHRSVAFLSPYGKTAWSSMRYEAIDSVFHDAGIDNAVKIFGKDFSLPTIPDSVSIRNEVLTLQKQWLARKGTDMTGMVASAFRMMELSVTREWRLQSFFDSIIDSLLADTSITAWVAVNDRVGIAALHYCKMRGIAVPGRISIISFDNAHESRGFGLTTCDFNIASITSAMISYIMRADSFSAGTFKPIVEPEGVILRRRTAGPAHT